MFLSILKYAGLFFKYAYDGKLYACVYGKSKTVLNRIPLPRDVEHLSSEKSIIKRSIVAGTEVDMLFSIFHTKGQCLSANIQETGYARSDHESIAILVKSNFSPSFPTPVSPRPHRRRPHTIPATDRDPVAAKTKTPLATSSLKSSPRRSHPPIRRNLAQASHSHAAPPPPPNSKIAHRIASRDANRAHEITRRRRPNRMPRPRRCCC